LISALVNSKTFDQEYLDASSPRSQQIREYMERTGRSGREAAEIAAHSTRDRKEVHSPGEVMAAHRKLAADFGHQADAVVRAARERQQHHEKPTNSVDRVRESLTFSRDKNFEREAVVDERVLIRDGLRRGMGDVTHAQVRSNLNARIASGEFQTVERVHMPGRQFTTASRYEINDVIRYSRGSKSTGIEAGEYGKVVSINSAANLLTVERSAGELANYDPRRLKGVSVYREVVREFSVGDRIQFTSPDRSLGIANRDLAVIDFVAADGMITARLDNNRRLDFDSKEHRHFDHGYAVKVAAKPELVQISTAYKQQSEGEKTLPRNKYVEIREEKPDTPEKAKWPEFKTCKFTTEAIVSDGIDKGELRKVCTEPTCSVHHPKKQAPKADASSKSEQEKRRREEALANATGIRVLQSIVAAVPVRLMKRDLLFVTEQLLPLLDEKRLEMVARNRSIKAKDGESVGKLLTAFIRKADEGTIGKLIVESVILLSARSHADGGKTLRAAAQVYGVDTDAVVLKVKQEFVAKEKGRNAKKVLKQPQAKGGKNARAA
jgi:hypothetical protein